MYIHSDHKLFGKQSENIWGFNLLYCTVFIFSVLRHLTRKRFLWPTPFIFLSRTAAFIRAGNMPKERISGECLLDWKWHCQWLYFLFSIALWMFIDLTFYVLPKCVRNFKENDLWKSRFNCFRTCSHPWKHKLWNTTILMWHCVFNETITPICTGLLNMKIYN